jgi:hypothetical protein
VRTGIPVRLKEFVPMAAAQREPVSLYHPALADLGAAEDRLLAKNHKRPSRKGRYQMARKSDRSLSEMKAELESRLDSLKEAVVDSAIDYIENGKELPLREAVNQLTSVQDVIKTLEKTEKKIGKQLAIESAQEPVSKAAD